VVLLAVFRGALGHGSPIEAAPKWPYKPPPEQDSCIARVNNYHTLCWMKADGWKNGASSTATTWSLKRASVLLEEGLADVGEAVG
jgi:hypothetical protein